MPSPTQEPAPTEVRLVSPAHAAYPAPNPEVTVALPTQEPAPIDADAGTLAQAFRVIPVPMQELVGIVAPARGAAPTPATTAKRSDKQRTALPVRLSFPLLGGRPSA